MFRKSLGCWLLSLLLGPACALALEIGEIQVSSSLNQLFDARIPLPKLTPEELNKVSVKLAPPAMYKEFGLDRASALGNLVFSIEYNAEGDVYVRAVSTQPIREPSLGLLLEFSWPRGKTFREFTVLLDPVQRLAKRPSDRTKTVLDASGGATTGPITAVAPPAQPPQPALAAPAATAPAAAMPTVAAPVASVVPPPAPVASDAAVPVAAVPPPTTPVAPDAAAPVAAVPAPVAPISTPTPPAPVAAVPPPTTPVAPDAAAPVAAVPAPVVPVSAPTPTTPLPTPVPPVPAGIAVAAAGPSPSLPVASPLPVEAKSAPAKRDSYGPVAAGEKLWKIALKVRPDPDITPEQMMQALLKANPHAFAKSGIDGLKVGSTLRVPTFREIAKFTGSAAAKRLADTEDTALAMLAETTRPRAEPTGAGTADGSQAKAENPTVFPLAMPENLESMVTVLTPAETVLAVLVPQPANVEAAPRIAATGSTAEAMETPVSGAADQPQGATASKLSKAGPESAKMPSPIRPPDSESAAKLAVAARAVSPPLLEPVTAISLPFTAVSEVMASVAKIPAFALPAQIAPEAIIAKVLAPPAQKIPAIGAVPPIALTRRDNRALTVGQPPEPPKASSQTSAAADPSAPKPSTASPSTTDLLAAIEEPVRRMASAPVDLATHSARATIEQTPPLTPPLASAPAGERRQKLLLSPSATTDERADGEHVEKTLAKAVSSPAVETSPVAVASPAGAATAIPPADTPDPRNQSGVRYGPVAPNERLWDIATKVRPDPGISKDVMMKALHMANPQAFSKTGINQMKAGVTLRIPTLQEIVKYTGSAAAKQLLEQQTKSTMPSPPESKASPESISRTETDPMPVAGPDTGLEPEAESGSKPSPQSGQPAADAPALSATPSAN